MAEDLSSARETLRVRSARNRRRTQQNGTAGGGNMNLQLNEAQQPEPQVEDAPLMVRLKDPHHLSDERPKSRLGQLNPFNRDRGGGGESSSAPKATTEFKETLKRPLSSLFRRPGSRAGREQQAAADKSNREKETFSDEVQEIGKDEEVISSRPRNESFDRVPLNLDLVARAPEFHVAELYNFDLPGFDNPEIKKFEDIDLNPLIRFLQLEEEVEDETVPFNWDSLYANILSESREEWDADEELPDNNS
uniref:Intraflagellar transport protein 43 homolog n=1 Tax=Panagrolaimus sp. ES5 TaxID=591445 RepID=A0AC34GNV8_9BILA